MLLENRICQGFFLKFYLCSAICRPKTRHDFSYTLQLWIRARIESSCHPLKLSARLVHSLSNILYQSEALNASLRLCVLCKSRRAQHFQCILLFAFIYSLIYSNIHLSICNIYLFIICLFVYLFIYSFIYLLVISLNRQWSYQGTKGR